MQRREFLAKSSILLASSPILRQQEYSTLGEKGSIKRLSQEPLHHFFGYYGINPWDKSMQYHLALESNFDDRRPEVKDLARVGYIDKDSHSFTPLTQTSAFNLQQGSMMHWIDVGDGEEFTYNGYDEEGKLVSYAFHFQGHQKRLIQGAIAAISPNQRQGIGLNFQRMSYCRATVGYAHEEEGYELVNRPQDDGLYTLDLKTGESSLFLSIAEVMKQAPGAFPSDRPAWFNHVLFNPSGERLLFFCRVRKEKKGFLTSLWTVNKDGSDLRCQIPFGNWVSHFDWKDDKTILVTSDVLGKREYLEFTDNTQEFRRIGQGILTVDGHCSYLHDPNWIISDTYALGPERLLELFLFYIPTNKKVSLGKFPHPPQYKGVIRCDLHPRLSHDGRIVSFDSVHEGSRQVYMVDISSYI